MRIPQLREQFAQQFADNVIAQMRSDVSRARPNETFQKERGAAYFDDQLFEVIRDAGFDPFFIFETGSTAWGTDRPESDIDLTVIGRDCLLDVFNYPRSEGQEPIFFDFNGVQFKADVRFFSVERILRLGFQSKITAVELTTGNLLQKETDCGAKALINALDAYYDPKAFAKSCAGHLYAWVDKDGGKTSAKVNDPKARRRAMRFICYVMQILEGRTTRPEMNVQTWYNEIASTQMRQRFQDVALWSEMRAAKPFAKFDEWLEGVDAFVRAMPEVEGLHPINPVVANEAMQQIYDEVNA